MVGKSESIVLRKYMMPELNILGINSDIITDSPVEEDAILVDLWA